MATAITVEGLAKRYRIGELQSAYGTLRESLVSGARRLARLDHTPHYEELWALKDVSFELQQGDVLGVVGRNGAGKSTLLKILTRITTPTCGRATIHGRVGSLLEVGTGFHPELTGRENVFLNGSVLGMKRKEIARKFPDIVEFSGVERFIDTPVKRYSSGMSVRLAFAVAAHLEPEVLLIDEVLAVGDAEFQRRCLGRMEDLSESGRTVIFVSHQMQAVSQLCDRALQLEDGQIVNDGPASDVVAQYLQSVGGGGSERYWPDLATAPGDEQRPPAFGARRARGRHARGLCRRPKPGRYRDRVHGSWGPRGIGRVPEDQGARSPGASGVQRHGHERSLERTQSRATTWRRRGFPAIS